MKKFFKAKEAGTITPLPPASPPTSSPSFGTPRLFDEYQARVASQTAVSNRPLSYQAPPTSLHPRESSDEARYSQAQLSASSSQRRRSQQVGVPLRSNRFPNELRATHAADAIYESYSDPVHSQGFRSSYDPSNTSDYELRSPQPPPLPHVDRRQAGRQQQTLSGMAAPLPPRSLRPAQPSSAHRRDGSMSKPIATDHAFHAQSQNGGADFNDSHRPTPHHPSADPTWARHRRSEDSDEDGAEYDDPSAPHSTAYPVYSGPEGMGDTGEVLISQGRYEETTLRELPKDKGKTMKLFGLSGNKDKKAKHREELPSSTPVSRASRDRDDAYLMSPPMDPRSEPVAKESGWMERWKKGAHQYQAARLQDREVEELVASRIGWLSANAYTEQDWMHILPIIDLVSQSEAASREAARALRKEFKHGSVDTQRRAVRIWALLTLNSSHRFRVQVTSKRFLDSIEDTIASSRTPLSVKETMLRVLGVLAFEFRDDAELAGVTRCWNKVKPSDRMKDGEPLEEDLFEFRLPQLGASFVQQQQPQQQPQQQGPWRRTSQRYTEPRASHPDIVTGAFSPPQQPPPTVDTAAQLRRHSAALARTQKPSPPTPQQSWQPPAPAPNGGSTADIVSTLEAAAASMDSRSASYHGSIDSSFPPNDVVALDEDVRRLHEECTIARSNAAVLLDTLLHEGLHADTVDLVDEFYTKVVRSQELIASQVGWASAQAERAKATAGGGETQEESLLGDLLEAHGRTSEAVRAVDEARRVAEEEEEERRVTERSKVEVRLDRSAIVQDSTGEVFDIGTGARAGGLLGVEGPRASGSRSPSPSGYPKSTAVLSPGSGFSSNSSSILSPPLPSSRPVAGPRSSRPLPVPRSDHSSDSSIRLTTSIHSNHSSTTSSQHSRDPSLTLPARSPLPLTPTLNIDTLQKGAKEEEDDLQTPVVPSAKALGKRRAVSVRYPSPEQAVKEAVPPLPIKNIANGVGGLRLG